MCQHPELYLEPQTLATLRGPTACRQTGWAQRWAETPKALQDSEEGGLQNPGALSLPLFSPRDSPPPLPLPGQHLRLCVGCWAQMAWSLPRSPFSHSDRWALKR